MAKVRVSRQSVDEQNQLSWVVVTIDENDLLEGEMPYIDLDLQSLEQ